MISSGRGRLLIEAVAVLPLVALFCSMAVLRVVDASEGVEFLAARLVIDGRIPYHDFVYPQTPLVPYLYAAWMTVAGRSWYSARLLSSIVAVALGIVMRHYVERRTGRRGAGIWTMGLFAVTALAFAWYPVIGGHAWVALLLFVAFALIDSGSHGWRWFTSGLLLGVAMESSIGVAALFPVFGVWALRAHQGKRPLLLFLTAWCLAVLPSAYFIVPGPDVWFFNVFGHYLLGGSAFGEAPGRLRQLLTLVGVTGSSGAASLQLTLLLVIWLAGLVSSMLLHEPLPRSAPIVFVLLVASLLAASPYAGYFYAILPFVLADVVVLVTAIRYGLAESRGLLARQLPHFIAFFAALYVLVAPVDMFAFTFGVDSPGTGPQSGSRQWRIPAINRVGQATDHEMAPGFSTAISWWPGYLGQSRTNPVPGLENPVALSYAAGLSPRQLRRFHVINEPELERYIESHAAPVVLLGLWMTDVRLRYGPVLERSGYVKIKTVEDVEIYRWMNPS